jgi:hypothetical protein
MPPLKILLVQRDANTTYATKRATRTHIEEMFANRPTIRTTLRGQGGYPSRARPSRMRAAS